MCRNAIVARAVVVVGGAVDDRDDDPVLGFAPPPRDLDRIAPPR